MLIIYTRNTTFEHRNTTFGHSEGEYTVARLRHRLTCFFM